MKFGQRIMFRGELAERGKGLKIYYLWKNWRISAQRRKGIRTHKNRIEVFEEASSKVEAFYFFYNYKNLNIYLIY